MKRIKSFFMALIAVLMFSANAMAQTGWSFDASKVTPTPGTDVTEISNIQIDYSNLSALSNGLDGSGYYGAKSWLSDGKKNYTVNVSDNFSNHVYGLRLTSPITAPGTYTLTIPAGQLYPYDGNTSDVNAEMTFTWTIKDPDENNTGEGPQMIGYTASVADGIVVKFSEPVNAKNNGFDIAVGYCAVLTEGTSEDGLAIKVAGSGTDQLTIKKYSGTFVNGNKYSVELKPTHITSVATGAKLTGTTTFSFTMGEGQQLPDVQVQNFTPYSGLRKTLDNVTAEFTKIINSVVDASKVEVKNEKGHSLYLTTVGLDSENPLGAININIGIPEEFPQNVLQEGTTYKCYIGAGAIAFSDGSVNKDPITFGGWEIPFTPIALSITPAANSVVEELYEITVAAENGESLELAGDIENIVVTGIMEYGVNTYAKGATYAKNADGSYTIALDKTLEPSFVDEVSDIEVSQASKSDVKIIIPAGMFKQGSRSNNAIQSIVSIRPNVVLGEITWTFNPAAGSTVEILGVGHETDNDGQIRTEYTIGITITEENGNLYPRIPDASGIKIYDVNGKAVKSFGQYDVYTVGSNGFALDLGPNPLMATGPAAKKGEFTMIIPADAVFYYTDPNYASTPTHPDEDIEVSWILKEGVATNINVVSGNKNSATYNLAGQKVGSDAKGVIVQAGKKIVR